MSSTRSIIHVVLVALPIKGNCLRFNCFCLFVQKNDDHNVWDVCRDVHTLEKCIKFRNWRFHCECKICVQSVHVSVVQPLNMHLKNLIYVTLDRIQISPFMAVQCRWSRALHFMSWIIFLRLVKIYSKLNSLPWL